MIAMHAGGHHRHGGSAPGGHGDRDSADSPRPSQSRGDGPGSSNEAVGQEPAGRTRPDSAARGCH
jgi:hypothetical protein